MYIGNHGDCLEIIYGKYVYEIEFNPPPPKSHLAEKRSREAEICSKKEGISYKIPKIETDCADDSEHKEQVEKTKEGKKQKKDTDGILKFLNRSKMTESTKTQVNEGVWESKDSGALLIYTSHGVEGRSKVIKSNTNISYTVDWIELVFRSQHMIWMEL